MGERDKRIGLMSKITKLGLEEGGKGEGRRGKGIMNVGVGLSKEGGSGVDSSTFVLVSNDC